MGIYFAGNSAAKPETLACMSISNFDKIIF